MSGNVLVLINFVKVSVLRPILPKLVLRRELLNALTYTPERSGSILGIVQINLFSTACAQAHHTAPSGCAGRPGAGLKAPPWTPTCPKLPVGLSGTREKGLQDQASSDKGRAVDKRSLCEAQETSDP